MSEFWRNTVALRFAVMAWLAAIIVACDGTVSAYQSVSGEAMGTTFNVTAHCPKALRSLPSRELELVEQAMSTYRADSELSLLNSAGASTPVTISDELAHVIGAAQRVARESRGSLDITVGGLVGLWGFGPASVDAMPSDEQISEALSQTGWQRIHLTEHPAGGWQIAFDAPVKLTLAAIAKGYGVDRIGDALDALGCKSYLVDVGGELRTRGVSPRGEPWRVGVEVPDETLLASVQRVLSLRDGAMATSGDYRNYRRIDGQRYSHTIDPGTGWPVVHNLASVTVVHASAMMADAYATALLVLGEEAGYELALEQGLAALFVSRVAAGGADALSNEPTDLRFDERYTPQLRAYLAPERTE
ncbi:MAG: FAD:protein FMN transferase [Pseudomonadaceae bacterium]|nr:FAD:protein FMN transferase [Pseudomonadaceae bacterium]